MNTTLANLIGTIRTIPLHDGLSDDAVVALTNIHLSIMTMIVANGLEEEYGSAEFHRNAMEQLFAICRKRSAGNQTLARSSRMTPAMYHVFTMPNTIVDVRKHNSCLNRSFRMVDEWCEKTKNARTLDENSRITEYGVLQCLLEAFIYIVDEDKETDKDYLFLKRRIEDWASELDDNGGWSGLSDYEAVKRINIMLGNSNANGDNRFDAQIEKALWFYYDRITEIECVDCQTLYDLYWALMWGIECKDSKKIDTITDCAVRMFESPFAVDRDKRLWYMAVLIDRECVRINKEIKQKMLAFSA